MCIEIHLFRLRYHHQNWESHQRRQKDQLNVYFSLARATSKCSLYQSKSFHFDYFFLSSNSSAWIEDKYIKNYAEYKDELIKSSKSAAFKEAVQKIDEFISDPIVRI